MARRTHDYRTDPTAEGGADHELTAQPLRAWVVAYAVSRMACHPNYRETEHLIVVIRDRRFGTLCKAVGRIAPGEIDLFFGTAMRPNFGRSTSDSVTPKPALCSEDFDNLRGKHQMPASGLRAKDVALRSDAELRTLRARAKTAIMRWVDDAAAPAGARAAMSRAVDAMLAELAERDAWFEVMTVVLRDTAGLDFVLRSRTWRAYPCDTMLAVTTVVPGWARGWREVIPDETARDHLTWFLHYARQYIHRSRVARILMAAWDRDRRVLHPFGPGGTNQFYSPGFRPAPSVVRMLDAAEREAKVHWGASARERRVRSVWSTANTLDPELHQAVFHFIRAQSLLAHDFELEAVVALDCALQAVATMLMRGGRLTNKATRAELCVALGLKQSAAGAAMEGSFVRNVVGAHAGGWRWWDSGEVTEELVPALTRTVRQAIGRAAAIEPEMRRVDPDPASWYEWLLVNFSTVWDSVWLPKASGSR